MAQGLGCNTAWALAIHNHCCGEAVRFMDLGPLGLTMPSHLSGSLCFLFGVSGHLFQCLRVFCFAVASLGSRIFTGLDLGFRVQVFSAVADDKAKVPSREVNIS